MSPRRVALARLARLWRDLRGAVTLRRHEKRVWTYVLRLLVVGLVLALPLKKLFQLGPVDGALALVKAGIAAGLVSLCLGLWFALSEAARQRRMRRAREAMA
jgi:hypothetical protein